MSHLKLGRLALISCFILSLDAISQEADSTAVASTLPRPTIGLALSGGGARGGAHLGVLRALEELKVPPGNRLEKLSGNRKAEYSMRINEQYRICFIWGESGPINVEVTEYH